MIVTKGEKLPVVEWEMFGIQTLVTPIYVYEYFAITGILQSGTTSHS